jgi:hypothetical protein
VLEPAAPSSVPELTVVVCAECGVEADERFTIAEHWTWWSDGCRGLLPFCPECAEREFGHRTSQLACRPD